MLPDVEIAPSDAPERPGTEVERAIAAIWHRLLDIEQVGLTDDFLDAGGDSLLVALLAEEIKRDLGTDIPAIRFFEHRTIADQARLVAAALEDAGQPATV